MTAVISYESESEIVDTGDRAEVRLAAPAHTKFVKIVDSDGTIRLVPFALLDDAERAILENRGLYDEIRTGLKQFAAGERVSSDWLLDDE
ncbi:MAG TPA: hypothetical protein PKK01_14935 [Mycobacterium sp.]|nr:hypothetical protein [Mycobacterium sp.]HPZ96190.1 hypothetical protein [Mycobacterium sp.]HQE16302.1 hypothetical protein [Mycobacterium sp.]